MNEEKIKILKRSIKYLSQEGVTTLDKFKLKELKSICRLHNDYINLAYKLLMKYLRRKHSEVRVAILRIIKELFNRSHHFRCLVVDDVQVLLRLTTGLDSTDSLPLPKPAAAILREESLTAVHQWNQKFGSVHTKLKHAVEYLRDVRKVDFESITAETNAEDRRSAQKKKEEQEYIKQKIAEALTEMKDVAPEIETVLKQLDSCYSLLFPSPDDSEWLNQNSENISEEGTKLKRKPEVREDTSKNESEDDEEFQSLSEGSDVEDDEGNEIPEGNIAHEEDKIVASRVESKPDEDSVTASAAPSESTELRTHGLAGHGETVEIQLIPNNTIEETNDNSAIIDALREAIAIINNKFLPNIQRWLELLPKGDNMFNEIRQALDWREYLQRATKRFDSFDITRKKRIVEDASSDSDTDDLEEVPEKEGFEPFIPEERRAEYGLPPSREVRLRQKREREAREIGLDPTEWASTAAILRKKLPVDKSEPLAGPSTESPEDHDERKKMLLEKAPTREFGVDLHHWENPNPEVPKMIRDDSLHRFWVSNGNEHEMEIPGAADSLKRRTMEFAGEFEPVLHTCRAPLGDGRVCTRADRIKCPFHGKIIPRDAKGKPLEESDNEEGTAVEEEKPWLDTKLLRDIEIATGKDLGSVDVKNKQKGKRRKTNSSKLTNLKKLEKTSRHRLKTKLQKSNKTVAQRLDAIDYKRIKSKFHSSAQFSWS